MALLAGVNYDPAVAVTKGAAASVIAAFDTTNLRLTFAAPSSGKVYVRMGCVIHGAATLSQFLFGVLDGATVRGRATPMLAGGNLAATSLIKAEAGFLITGLTPGTNYTFDAAWGCETFVTGSLLKYGGPNNTTANDAFGGFQFEIWDA
jgi:hypothetical protein